MANLTQEQSAYRRRLRKWLFDGGGVIGHSCNGTVTVAMLPTIRNGRVALVATSIASPHEVRIVRAVGELHALERLTEGRGCIMPWPKDKDEQYAAAEYWANLIASERDYTFK